MRNWIAKRNMYFIYSSVLFNLHWFITGIVSIVLYFLHQNIFTTQFESWQVAIVFVLVISFISGASMTALTRRLILRPILNMLTPMQALAEGDFDTRIEPHGILCPKELLDFSEQFNRTAKELGCAQMMRNDFINNFSHEFKTPIVSICGFARRLQNPKLSQAQRVEYTDIIASEAERLASLSTNILNLSRVENQQLLLDKERFDLSEQLRRSIITLEQKWSAKDLQMEILLPDRLDVTGNAELLNQVWINLLDNAIKFSSERGKIRVVLTCDTQSAQVTIQDFGCGMDEDTTAHMFDKFYQADTSHATEGNGLGLSLVRRIVDLHQGSITVDSTTAQGTAFTVELTR